MNIIFTRFPFESAPGGAENQTLWLMDGLRRNGYQVSFVGSCSVLLEQSSKLKIKNEKLKIGKPPVSKWSALTFLRKQWGMKNKLIRFVSGMETKPDVIFMLSLSEKLLLTKWAANKGIKIFWIEHDRIGRWLTWNPWLPRLRKLSRLVKTITVSELSRRMYIDLGWREEDVFAIGNGVPEKVPGKKYQVPSKNLRIGCVARLSPEKGVDLLIAAASELPEVSLTIVGRGRDENYLRKLILESEEKNCDEPGRIKIITDFINQAEFFAQIDVLVLPSREHDPFGLTAAEAMMSGLPVIVTDRCGIADYLQNEKDSIIVKANSMVDLKQGIKLLADDHFKNQLAAEGQKTARERFTAERMVKEYEKLLEN